MGCLFFLMFTLIPLFILVVFAVNLAKGLAQWSSNNAQPVCTSAHYARRWTRATNPRREP